ncbi:VWA domain-containing protein [Actinomadura sp. ATCC 31491]|uniref:VWA domain-containing protein n=1 Tax=Actinomadura luzonensis TaxID=2805427 RepID=A0ABT0G8C4_9ACTN|nr:VWA domain-containing protein [Actinomadura luzonensis]MCK2220822.1 VWA domain-containing protein [Actinomadura luzonensis]
MTDGPGSGPGSGAAGRPDGGALAATMTGFARTLRAAGVGADHERTRGLLDALAHLDVTDRAAVYWAGRLTLCAGPDDLPRYDRCFAAYFGGHRATTARAAVTSVTRHLAARDDPDAAERDGGATARPPRPPPPARRGAAPPRRGPAHRGRARRGAPHAGPCWPGPAPGRRRSRRFEPAHRGVLDQRRTVREALRKGEVARLRRRRHATRPRPVELFVDVSGSMAPYAETLLRFAHALVRSEPRATRVYSVGTRLTPITAELRHRDPGTALNEASKAIPDWSGGTRLGEELKEYLARFSARGAIVVIASDGWERGDPALLGAQLARLSRQAYRMIWVNPHKGYEDYQPLTGGMRAALPYLDDLVAGHSLAAFERLSERLAHA